MMFKKNLQLFTIFNLFFIQNIKSNSVNISKEMNLVNHRMLLCKVVRIIDYIFFGKISLLKLF